MSKHDALVALIYTEDQLFLIKRSDDVPTHKGEWAFPGGGMRPGESEEETLFREVKEETGFEKERFVMKGPTQSYLTIQGTYVRGEVLEFQGRRDEFDREVRSNQEWERFTWLDIVKLKRFGSSSFASAKLVRKDEESRVYFIDLDSISSTPERVKQDDILLWGLTAKMIYNELL